jgi:di/tricarboxylate transporter
LTGDAWLTLGILLGLFALLVWGRFPTWAVFVAALALVLTLGIADEGEAFQGFSNTGVLTVVVLYAVAAGMYATGAISIIADKLIGRPESARQANKRILPATAAGSAFLNNTPLVAMMIPVVQDLGRTMRLSTSKMFMQLSDASILGGSATLIGTSTNLIIAGLVLDRLGEDLSVFFPTRIGLPVAAVGILFLIYFAGRLLPERADEGGAEERRLYRAEFYLPEDSPLVGSTLWEAGLAQPAGGELISIRRGDRVLTKVASDLRLERGDVLTFSADIDGVAGLWSTIGLYSSTPREVTGREYACHLVEVVITTDPAHEGRAVGRLPFRAFDSELNVVAMSQGGEPADRPIEDMRVAAGDNYVLEVSDDFFDAGALESEFALIHRLRGFRVQRTDHAWEAGIIVVSMVLLSAFGVMSLFNAALLAVAALIATGCLTFRRAFGSIDWEVYVVLAAAVGLEPAVSNSGLGEVIADGLAEMAGGNALLALVVVFVGTVVLTNVISNAAAAALMFPIVLGIADGLDANWEPFVAILMIGASCALINPAGYQTHLMVQKPGGYTFIDFLKVGLPLTIIVGVVAIPLAALLYGL